MEKKISLFLEHIEINKEICTIDKCIEEKFECKYNKFINFLIRNRHRKLQITSSSAYFYVSSSYKQKVLLNAPFIWNENIQVKNIEYDKGIFKVKESGIYDLFGDIVTNEPIQYILFINGVPDLNSCFGRNSSANRCLLSQFVSFKEGDVFEIRNCSSYTADINSIGSAVGQSIMFSGFKLSPSDYVDTHPKLPSSLNELASLSPLGGKVPSLNPLGGKIPSLSPLGGKVPPPLVYPPEEEAPVPPTVPKGSSIQKKPWNL